MHLIVLFRREHLYNHGFTWIYNDTIRKHTIRFLLYRVLIKYCVFFEDFKIIRTLVFLCFLSVSVCVHTPGR